MTPNQAIKKIEELLEIFARQLQGDQEYLDALTEMSERATNAYNARQEELNVLADLDGREVVDRVNEDEES